MPNPLRRPRPLQVSRHARCRIRVTVSPQPGEFPQKGHKVALFAVMVTHVEMGRAGTLVNVQRTSEEF